MVSNAGRKISTLSIDSVDASHSGIYTCVAENKAGKTSFSAKLNVNGKNLRRNNAVDFQFFTSFIPFFLHHLAYFQFRPKSCRLILETNQ